MNTETIVALIGGAVTLLSAGVAALAGRRAQARPRGHQYDPGSEQGPPDAELHQRLREVEAASIRQQRLASTYSIANTLLTFGQFIIGGVLASSFVQSTIPGHLAGTLGVVVLLSSLIRQHFRPDVRMAGASRRAAKLRGLSRVARDELSFAEREFPVARPAHEIQTMLTSGLNQVEEDELLYGQTAHAD